jgi:hypothetical protein
MTNVTADHKLFKIKASRCALQVGDRLTAETFLGDDADTGEPVRAGSAGQVRAVSFSGAEYALLVLVEVEASATENSLQAEPVCFKVDANWCTVLAGEPVMPQTVIGRDAVSGEKIRAGIRGRVEAVSFSDADYSLMVLLRP